MNFRKTVDYRPVINALLRTWPDYLGRIIVTRHFVSPKGPGHDDKTRGLAEGEQDKAKRLGAYIKDNYLLGNERAVISVHTGLERSIQSVDGIIAGITESIGDKAGFTISSKECPELALPTILKQEMGWSSDALSEMAAQLKSCPCAADKYTADVETVGMAYAPFLLKAATSMKPGTVMIVSGHAPGVSSHLLEVAECFGTTALSEFDARKRTYDYLMENGCAAKGSIACSYVVMGPLPISIGIVIGNNNSPILFLDPYKLNQVASESTRRREAERRN